MEALMHRQSTFGHGIFYHFLVVSDFVFLSRLWSCKYFYLLCMFALCNLNPCLDLEIFPQMSQGWETSLIIWLASMCVIIFRLHPSFPHTLHILAFCVPSVVIFPPMSICSSNCWASALTKATGLGLQVQAVFGKICDWAIILTSRGWLMFSIENRISPGLFTFPYRLRLLFVVGDMWVTCVLYQLYLISHVSCVVNVPCVSHVSCVTCVIVCHVWKTPKVSCHRDFFYLSLHLSAHWLCSASCRTKCRRWTNNERKRGGKAGTELENLSGLGKCHRFVNIVEQEMDEYKTQELS